VLESVKIVVVADRVERAIADRKDVEVCDAILSSPLSSDALISAVRRLAGQPESLVRIKAAEPVGGVRFWLPAIVRRRA
jgi:hypothetical protein